MTKLYSLSIIIIQSKDGKQTGFYNNGTCSEYVQLVNPPNQINVDLLCYNHGYKIVCVRKYYKEPSKSWILKEFPTAKFNESFRQS